MLYFAMLYYIKLCYIVLCFTILSYAILCYCISIRMDSWTDHGWAFRGGEPLFLTLGMKPGGSCLLSTASQLTSDM